MATTLGFKDLIDLPEWRPIANAPVSGTAGVNLACDLRNNEDRHPEIFQLGSAILFAKYSVKNDEWMPLASPALAGVFGAGADSVFVPDAGPNGTLAAGATTTSVILTTALPAAVAVNQLANRGDSRGFKVRIIGNAAGSSGKTEEKLIVGNTAGTTPTIYLESALTFSPIAGDRYEILSGRVYLLSAGLLAAGAWKYYDVATNSYSASLSIVNLPATISTDSDLLSMSELYVPNDKAPGEGFFGNLVATASGAASITGQAAGGDAGVLLNEYRNFQIRIVQDTAIPTAVGQRRRITSHTAGASPVYTVDAWAVTPSTTATYVVERWTDCILLWTTLLTTTFNYSISGNAWTTATWAVRPSACGAGVSAFGSCGITLDAQKSQRDSYIYVIRGAATADIDLFDIAGAATGSWTGNIAYGNKGQTFTTGTATVHDWATLGGKYVYVNVNGTQRFARFDVVNRILEPYADLEYVQGAVVAGGALALTLFIDGATKLAFLIVQRRTGAECFELVIQR